MYQLEWIALNQIHISMKLILTIRTFDSNCPVPLIGILVQSSRIINIYLVT